MAVLEGESTKRPVSCKSLLDIAMSTRSWGEKMFTKTLMNLTTSVYGDTGSAFELTLSTLSWKIIKPIKVKSPRGWSSDAVEN